MNFLKLYPLVEENIILGFPVTSTEDIVLNFCLILAKHYIYTCKRNEANLFFLNFLALLKFKLNLEEGVHISNFTLDKYHHIWGYLKERL